MNFIADLHIHSRYSMATSKSLAIPELAFWAAQKGINVLGTGDFTHPAWRVELKESLAMDEGSGLLTPKSGPGAGSQFFCLQTEISAIYKKDGKTRKIHNLVFAPDFTAADAISARLERIGRLDADGRPILKLDARDLLEIILESSPEAVLIPAHIWTPWYSLFGSRSGFDAIEDCFGDLTPHIFALETGLSSDPPMNRMLSALDRFALISNSDAHSGPNLGREANFFAGSPSYDGIFMALRNSAKRVAPVGETEFLGTLEFYPEEGKYHLDGHRACGTSLSPAESRELGGLCPVCGKPLTIGVLHRVLDLADRGQPATPPLEPEARMLAPLTMILSHILGAAPGSQKVKKEYRRALGALGPELHILCNAPLDEARDWWEPLGEAIARMREGKVSLKAGYDGEYGRVEFFDQGELADIRKGLDRRR